MIDNELKQDLIKLEQLTSIPFRKRLSHKRNQMGDTSFHQWLFMEEENIKRDCKGRVLNYQITLPQLKVFIYSRGWNKGLTRDSVYQLVKQCYEDDLQYSFWNETEPQVEIVESFENNQQDFTQYNGHGYMSQRAVSRLTGVNQSSISRYVDAMTDTTMTRAIKKYGFNGDALNKFLGKYATNDNISESSKNKCIQLLIESSKKGLQQWLDEQAGIKPQQTPDNMIVHVDVNGVELPLDLTLERDRTVFYSLKIKDIEETQIQLAQDHQLMKSNIKEVINRGDHHENILIDHNDRINNNQHDINKAYELITEKRKVDKRDIRVKAFKDVTSMINRKLIQEGKEPTSEDFKYYIGMVNKRLYGIRNFNYNRDNMTPEQENLIINFESALTEIDRRHPTWNTDKLFFTVLGLY